MFITSRHWQKNRQHVEIARAYRMALQRVLKDERSATDTTVPEVRKVVKWLSDKYGVGREAPSLDEDRREFFVSLGLAPDVEHTPNEIRGKLDDVFSLISPTDLRSLRDFGDARYKLEALGKMESPLSASASVGWSGLNLVS